MQEGKIVSDKKDTNQMWGGRFAQGASDIMDAINVSIDIDKHLYRQDIQGSLAHSEMLISTGIISADDGKKNSKWLA